MQGADAQGNPGELALHIYEKEIARPQVRMGREQLEFLQRALRWYSGFGELFQNFQES